MRIYFRGSLRKDSTFLLCILIFIFLSAISFGAGPSLPHGTETISDEFLQAIHQNDLDKVQKLINKGENINAPSGYDDSTALMHAVEILKGEYSFFMASTLLEAGADVNTQNLEGDTALHRAALWNDNPDVIRLLLTYGAEVEIFSFNNCSTPLMESVHGNINPVIVKELISAGADVNAKSYDITVLMAAVSNSNTEVITALLDASASLDDTDDDGNTVLMFAARENPSDEVVSILLDRGADVTVRSSTGHTALMEAAIFNPNPKIVELLLDVGADINAESDRGMTAIIGAGASDSVDIIRVLIEAGADPHSRIANNYTMLMQAAKATENPEVVRYLLGLGLYHSMIDDRGMTALDYARNRLDRYKDQKWNRQDYIDKQNRSIRITLRRVSFPKGEILFRVGRNRTAKTLSRPMELQSKPLVGQISIVSIHHTGKRPRTTESLLYR